MKSKHFIFTFKFCDLRLNSSGIVWIVILVIYSMKVTIVNTDLGKYIILQWLQHELHHAGLTQSPVSVNTSNKTGKFPTYNHRQTGKP